MTKLTKFACFAMGLSGIGMLATVAMPFVIRAQTYSQFHGLGMDSAVDTVANAEIASRSAELVSSLWLSVVGIVITIGLFRRREWARQGWLIFCGVLLVAPIASAVSQPSLAALLAIVFRAAVLSVSLRVLSNVDVRREFAGELRGVEEGER